MLKNTLVETSTNYNELISVNVNVIMGKVMFSQGSVCSHGEVNPSHNAVVGGLQMMHPTRSMRQKTDGQQAGGTHPIGMRS